MRCFVRGVGEGSTGSDCACGGFFGRVSLSTSEDLGCRELIPNKSSSVVSPPNTASCCCSSQNRHNVHRPRGSALHAARRACQNLVQVHIQKHLLELSCSDETQERWMTWDLQDGRK